LFGGGVCDMRWCLGISLAVILAAVTAAAPGLKDPPSKGPDIAGEWECLERLIGGRPDPELRTQPAQFTLAAGRWVSRTPGGPGNEAVLDLDPRAEPPALTVYAADDPGRARGATLTAIYRLDGDTLTICYVLGRGPRPTDFESKAGTEIRLMTLRRVKDK
jgi:uncharacterized protein (TIGR03067 family)